MRFPRICLCLLSAGVCLQASTAPAVDITPTWTGYDGVGGGNSGRTSYQGFTDQYTIATDVGGGTIQQYPTFDIGTGWIGTSVTGPITNATLTFPEAYQSSGPAVTYSVFEVPGTPGFPDYARTAIDNFNGAGVNGGELLAWSNAHTKYGLVTTAQLNAAGSVSFDITALLEGWRTGTLTTNPGWLMILVNDPTHTTGAGFGAASGNPTMNGTILVNNVPEPASLGALGLASLFLKRNKRSR